MSQFASGRFHAILGGEYDYRGVAGTGCPFLSSFGGSPDGAEGWSTLNWFRRQNWVAGSGLEREIY
jgi:hypothetical protein